MIVNKKDKYIKIYENGKWIYKDKKTTMDDLIDGKYFILDEHFNEITSDELSKIQRIDMKASRRSTIIKTMAYIRNY